MNERIQELIKQSNGHWNLDLKIDHHGDFITSHSVKFQEDDIEKFAELIVRECANHCDLLLDHKISSEWSRGTHDCSKAIKKHFGVEE